MGLSCTEYKQNRQIDLNWVESKGSDSNILIESRVQFRWYHLGSGITLLDITSQSWQADGHDQFGVQWDKGWDNAFSVITKKSCTVQYF